METIVDCLDSYRGFYYNNKLNMKLKKKIVSDKAQSVGDNAQKVNLFSLTKVNYIVIIASVVVIAIGFMLMHGSSTDVEFNPDVFSFRRITIAPIVCMLGFLGMIVGIMIKTKQKNELD